MSGIRCQTRNTMDRNQPKMASTKKADKKPVAKKTPSTGKPKLKLVKKTGPSELSPAVQAMEHADKVLAYGEFQNRLKNGTPIDGALVSAAAEYATRKAAEEVTEKIQTAEAGILNEQRQALMMNTHPFAQVYRTAVEKVHETRRRLGGTATPQHLFDRLDLILGAGGIAAAEKLATKATQSAEFHFLAEWARGHVKTGAASKDPKHLEDLANFLVGKGQDARAAEVRSQAVSPLKPTGMDLSRLSKTEAVLVNFVKNAGGSVTTDALKNGFATGEWSVRDMSRMMDIKALSTPREGVVRLDESKLMAPAEPPKDKEFGEGKVGPPRKSHAPKVKVTKCDKTPRCSLVQAHEGECVVKAPVSTKNKPEVNPGGLCLCGCGSEVKKTSRFGIGHDAKLHSAVLKAAKGDKEILAKLPVGNETTAAYLKQAPWMTPEVLKAIGL